MNEPADHDGNKRPQGRIGIWLPLSVLLALILAIAAGSYSRLAMRMPSTLNAARLSTAPAGSSLNLMVEVSTMPSPTQLDVRLLDKRGSEYIRTGKSVELQLQADTRMLMGKRDALRPKAVLDVSVVAQGRNTNPLRVRTITVLTGYVQVH